MTDLHSEIRNPKSQIALVVFDLGRVLLRISDDWDHAARLAGLPGLSGMTGDLSTKATRATAGKGSALAALFDRFEVGTIKLEGLLSEVEALTGRPAGDVGRVMDAVLVEPYHGATAILDRLDEAGIKTACLSNTNQRHWDLISDRSHPAHFPLDRLTFAFASQRIGHAKPSPAIYHHVEQATGVEPAGILFFDDLAENVQAAADRGWNTELVSRCDNPVPWMTERLRAYGVLADGTDAR